MALTNAEKQAKYRERHLENGTKTRGISSLKRPPRRNSSAWRITGIAARLR